MGVDKGSGGMCAHRHTAAGACNAPLRRDTVVNVGARRCVPAGVVGSQGNVRPR